MSEGKGRGTPQRMAPAAPASKAKSETSQEAPRAYGPRSIGGLIARVTKPGFRRRSPAAMQVMAEWLDILGPELGPRTVPQKLSAGTLTIGASGPTAMELQHLGPQLMARINGYVGQDLVQRLRFVQQPDAIVAAGSAGRSRPAPRPPPELDMEPGPLRDALGRLAQAIEQRSGTPPKDRRR
jgi:hypothetical protein